MQEPALAPRKVLALAEAVYYRDKLREARYAAQRTAEDFREICYAIEELGRRLSGRHGGLGEYRKHIRWFAERTPTTSSLVMRFPSFFTSFDSLYESILQARNDAMHTGAFARHAASRGIELCIALEEAIMSERRDPRIQVKDHMVKQAVTVSEWHPVGVARQLMLMHSFSFLPVNLGGEWKLVSERSIVDYLYDRPNRNERLAMSIADAVRDGLLELGQARSIDPEWTIDQVLARQRESPLTNEFTLWLVVDGEQRQLVGVLSPFELM